MEKQKEEIIESLKKNPKDVGSSEVQIGLLSKKIENLTGHFKTNKNDKHSTRGLLKAVNQRKRLLVYLKKQDPNSYANILTKLNLRK
ncbi:MAG: small subunit ribosomal protein S15 [Pelagibacterales bacterium]|nr:small subunit ribosomal protein S15 [Pelagibacterales bacterium]